MVKLINLTWLTLCIVSLSTNHSLYKIEDYKVKANVQVEVKLKKELEDILKCIEETLNYSSQIKVLDLEYKEHILSIDLSKDLLQYGGGTSAEYYIGKKLMSWAFEETDAETIYLLIDGQAYTFPEGSGYNVYSRENYLQNMKRIMEEENDSEENHICDTK